MKALRNFLAAGTTFLLLFQPSCSTQSIIARYSGDGEIEAMPDYGFWQGGGGCTVKFKPIKLDQSSHFIYHFKGLPHWRFELLFAIEDSREWENKRSYEFFQSSFQASRAETYACYSDLKGTLTMSLKDAKGNVVLQFQRKFSELIWSSAGRLSPWQLYDEPNVNFTPNSSMEYTLEIKINPDYLLKDDESYVEFRGGGHEGISIGF